MLKTKYLDDWRLIAELSADWPYTQEEVYQALEQEQFVGNEERTYCLEPKSEILQHIRNNMLECAPKLLAEICEQEQFKKDLWHLDSTEQMTNNVKLMCSYVKDAPGFTTNIHIDNRMTVCTGMLFFNKEDDPEQATTFYTTFQADKPVRMSSEYRKGWYAANTSISWHTGGNASNRTRYSLMLFIQLNLEG